MTTEDEIHAEEQRTAWIQHGLGELIMWMNYATEKVHFIEAELEQGRIRHIEKAELVFVITAMMNRLAQIDLRTTDHIRIESKLIPWLADMTGWPKPVAETFWSCLRSPVVHMGSSFAMADYGVRTSTGVPILASLDLSGIRQHDPDPGLAFPPGPGPGYCHGDGWSAIHHQELGPPLHDAWSGEHVGVTFEIYGVIDVVKSMLKKVAQGIRDAGTSELDELSALNRRLPFIRSETLDPLLSAGASAEGR